LIIQKDSIHLFILEHEIAMAFEAEKNPHLLYFIA